MKQTDGTCARRSDSVPTGGFSSKGGNVIAFYYGGSDIRTELALRDLVLKDHAGATEPFLIAPKTVVEGAGAIEGDRYDPDKGDQLYVFSAAGNGRPEALFTRLK